MRETFHSLLLLQAPMLANIKLEAYYSIEKVIDWRTLTSGNLRTCELERQRLSGEDERTAKREQQERTAKGEQQERTAKGEQQERTNREQDTTNRENSR